MNLNWKDILVSPQSNVQDVLKIIDQAALQLALVVDEDEKLLGIVTDGDIRRGLIAGKPLSISVSEIMNSSPTTITSNLSKNKILAILERNELSALPIINNGKIIGLETLKGTLHRSRYDNPVFLMAGGFGTRLRPLTDNCPKPLLQVGDKPILETVLINFIKAGFHNFFISTHYLPKMIRDYFSNGSKWGVTIEYIHESTPLGTGGALGLLPKNKNKLPVIVMNGDVLTKVKLEDLLTFHNKNNAVATMCVREYEYKVPFGVIESEGSKIKSMVEKPTQRFHVNAGIYVLNNEIQESVKENEVIDMPTLLERHLDNNVLIYPFFDYWLDVGRMDDYNKAQLDFKTLGF